VSAVALLLMVGLSHARMSCVGPGGTVIEVGVVVSETLRTSFRERDEGRFGFSALAKAMGKPRGFEIWRVMAARPADYMTVCVRSDCSQPVLFGPFSSFTAVLTDSTTVRSIRLLFPDGPKMETNTRVWDTGRGALVNVCGREPYMRDVGGGVLCFVAFPYGSVRDIRRVVRLTFNEERG